MFCGTTVKGCFLKLKFQKASRLSSTVVTMKPIGKAKIVNAIHRIETKKYAFTSKTALFRKNLTVFHLSSLWLCRGSHWSCSIKKVFLEISQNSQENTLRLASLLKKRLRHRCFLVNFSKYLRTPFLQISFGYKWLQLDSNPQPLSSSPVWLNGWVFVYELSGCGFESSCSH